MSARLGAITNISIGKTPARANPEFWGRGHPWLSIADMNQGRSLSTTKEQITDIAVAVTRPRLVPSGTVVMSFKLSIGKLGITEVPMFTNEAIAALEIRDRGAVDARYLMWALDSQDLSAIGNRAVLGTTLNRAALEAIRIPLPPLPEQRRIAAILDEADALRLARGTSLSAWLELRARVIDSAVARSVSEQPLGELVPRIESGRSPVCHDTPAPDGDWGVLKLGAISSGRFLATENKALPTDIQPFRSAEVHEGDVLMSRKNTIDLVGASVYVESTRPRLLMSDLIYRLPLKEGAPIAARYLQAYLSTDVARSKIRAMAGGSAASMSNISKERLSRLPVPFPSRSEHDRLVVVLSQFSEERRVLSSQLDDLNSLFASLQHRAFRGEL